MHRARVSTVAGKKALAEGKWLTVIGNRRVHSGDWVWTVVAFRSTVMRTIFTFTKEENYGNCAYILTV